MKIIKKNVKEMKGKVGINLKMGYSRNWCWGRERERDKQTDRQTDKGWYSDEEVWSVSWPRMKKGACG